MTIQSNQDLAISLQTQTNQLLGAAVERLDETLGAAREVEGEPGDRLSSLCDELAGSLTGLMAHQDEMGRRDREQVEDLDRLVRHATGLVSAQEQGRGREQSRKRADILARGREEVRQGNVVPSYIRQEMRSPAADVSVRHPTLVALKWGCSHVSA